MHTQWSKAWEPKTKRKNEQVPPVAPWNQRLWNVKSSYCKSDLYRQVWHTRFSDVSKRAANKTHIWKLRQCNITGKWPHFSSHPKELAILEESSKWKPYQMWTYFCEANSHQTNELHAQPKHNCQQSPRPHRLMELRIETDFVQISGLGTSPVGQHRCTTQETDGVMTINVRSFP